MTAAAEFVARMKLSASSVMLSSCIPGAGVYTSIDALVSADYNVLRFLDLRYVLLLSLLQGVVDGTEEIFFKILQFFDLRRGIS